MAWVLLFIAICFLAYWSIPDGSPMEMLAEVLLAMSLFMFVMQVLF